MKTIIIDGEKIISMMDIHELFASELNFPDYYGKNLDALFDCLTEHKEPVEIRFSNRSRLVDTLGVSFRRLMAVIDDAASENENIKIMK